TSLGQRFLVDRGVLAAIVDAAELSPDDDVLEIGPGPGVLTAALASRVRSVTAVEIDPRMVALLGETLAEHRNVRIVQADALKVDLLALAPRPITRIVANLPYQITTPLLERFLADDRRPALVVVLVQQEVARRMAATARDARERGYLSVFTQSFAEPRIVRRVPARAFRPAPRVDSAVVALRTRPRPALAEASARPALAHVRVRKRIPVASGLGGGSSDAGAVLRGLARAWRLDGVDLAPVAARIGSDVPFFVSGAAYALVGGRGELVEA